MRRPLAVILVIVAALVALSIIFASSGVMMQSAPPRSVLLAIAPTARPPVQEQNADGRFDFAAQDRLVIKNASLQVVVASPQQTMVTISKMAEDMGGWVVTSSAFQTKINGGASATQASLTIRVPAERLTEALAQIKASAVSVDSDTVTGQDVTQEYTDLSSQLTNLEAAEAQLRKIMDAAGKTDDVLAVHKELVRVRGEIEVTRGRMQYYKQSAAFSSIQVSLLPQEQEKPLEIGAWRPLDTVKGAFEALLAALRFAVSVLIWLVVLGLPLLILFGLPAWLISKAVRSRLGKVSVPPQPAPADVPPAQP
jgi:Domain of unknown function (DUF4349)